MRLLHARSPTQDPGRLVELTAIMLRVDEEQAESPSTQDLAPTMIELKLSEQAEALVHEASPMFTRTADSQALVPAHEPDPMVRFEVEVPLAREHALFPRHESFPMVAYSENEHAPWVKSNVPAGSETQESEPTLVKRTVSQAENPLHDWLPKFESELAQQAYWNAQELLPAVLRVIKVQAHAPRQALTAIGGGGGAGQQPGCPSAVQVSSGTPLGKLD